MTQTTLSDDVLLEGETLPTPEEIAQRCAAIQAKWSDAVREKRRVYQPQRVETRVLGLPDNMVPVPADYDD